MLLAILGLVVLDDVDAHLRQHRHHVLDLFRRNLIRRQDLVELIVGDVAALAGLGDHLLDGGLAHIQRDVISLYIGLTVVSIFSGHSLLHTGGG